MIDAFHTYFTVWFRVIWEILLLYRRKEHNGVEGSDNAHFVVKEVQWNRPEVWKDKDMSSHITVLQISNEASQLNMTSCRLWTFYELSLEWHPQGPSCKSIGDNPNV